jgi:hypothetical protein
MVNTKGGFLVKDGGEADEEIRRKEREKNREKQRTQHNLEIREQLQRFFIPTLRIYLFTSDVFGSFPQPTLQRM